MHVRSKPPPRTKVQCELTTKMETIRFNDAMSVSMPPDVDHQLRCLPTEQKFDETQNFKEACILRYSEGTKRMIRSSILCRRIRGRWLYEATRSSRRASAHTSQPTSQSTGGFASLLGAACIVTATTLVATKHQDNHFGVAACEAASAKPFRLKDVYEITKVLGQGAYGMVYQGRRKSDGLSVAVKTMGREYTGKTAFEREVAALQRLSEAPHRNVVKLYDLHRDDKNYYLVMELVEGGELFDHLIENGAYSEAKAASFIRQFAEALCFVHSTGYVHADLKPENLMLEILPAGDNDESTNTESLVLVDFGCAAPHDLSRNHMLLPAQEFAAGCSFLHQVALGNQFELQRMLQEAPDLVNFRDYDKRTALHVASSEGHLDICRFLVEKGAPINRVDRWGGSPLDDAHRHGHKEVLQLLGQKGATFGSAAAAIDKFINAASEGNVEEIQALLKFGTIDLNQGDYDRRTALHLAAGEGRLAVVKLLCEAGADSNVEDRWGNRPLDDARSAKKNSVAITKVLKEHGASAKKGVSSDFWQTAESNVDSGSEGPVNAPLEGKSGTVAYWAPELFDKGQTPTPAVDIWAAGVIVYIMLTGSHPFDKYADATEEDIAQKLQEIRNSVKVKDREELVDVMTDLVFDDRVEGLSDSCIALMRQMMNPDPTKRLTSEEFRRHPWVQGLTASWTNLTKGFAQLEAGLWQSRFKAEILKKFSSSLGLDKDKGPSNQDLETMFRALDLKKTGVLDLGELEKVLRDSGVPDENIEKMFACSDLDGTGAIRLDEFRALMSEHGSRKDGGGGQGLQVKYLQDRFKNHILNRFDSHEDLSLDLGKLRDIFNAIDLEGNGVLDPHEIRVVLRSAGEPDDVISRIVASLDTNRDGGVDWSEFQEIMGFKTNE